MPAEMPRVLFLQPLLDLYADARYLEIGVAEGATFRTLRTKSKTGVDPHFAFDYRAEAAPGARFFETTSDEFFTRLVEPGDRYDVVFLDGLHTFEQTARDLFNALDVLSDDGVIVIDDVRPSSYLASLPDLETFREMRKETGETSGQWMGDVYRLVYFIDAFMPRCTYRTVAENHGMTVLWRDPRTGAAPGRTMRAICSLEYSDVVLNMEALRLAPFEAIVHEVQAWLARRFGRPYIAADLGEMATRCAANSASPPSAAVG